MADLYLLDTNILVHYIRRDDLGQQIEAVYGLLVTPIVPLLSIVTEGEVRSLAIQWSWGAPRLQQLNFLLSLFSVVSLDYNGLISAYAVIDAHSKSIGHAMGTNDVWIAATAHVTGARLLTTDHDFDHLIPGFLSCDILAASPI